MKSYLTLKLMFEIKLFILQKRLVATINIVQAHKIYIKKEI